MLIPYAALLETPIKSYMTYVQNDPRSYLPAPGVENTEFVQAAIKQSVVSIRYFLIYLILGIALLVINLRCRFHWLTNTIILLFLLTDLFIFGKTFVSSVDPHHWDLKQEAVQFLSRDKNQFRSAVITSFGPKYGITTLLQQIGGDYPYVLNRYSRLFNLANGQKPEPSMKIGAIRLVTLVHNLLNLKYLVVNSKHTFDIPGYYEVYNDGVLSILHNEYALKRVYIPQEIKIVNEEKEALRRLLELPSIRGEQIILERDSVANLPFASASLVHRKDPSETVEIVAYGSDRIELRANLASDGWLILTDSFYPGWKATIDGQSEAIMVPANYVFRAVYVPQGHHNIVFQYKPTYFSVSLAIALITLMGSCIIVICMGDVGVGLKTSAGSEGSWGKKVAS
jgi:hypothetical protein